MINWFKRVSRKFLNAIKGLIVMVKEERSLLVHFFATFVVVLVGIISKLNVSQWLFIIFAIIIVISFEIINTAIEYLVDIVSFEYSVKAKKIKDVSAMATLFVTIGAVIVGILVFLNAWGVI